MYTEPRGYHIRLYDAINDALMEEPDYAAICYRYLREIRDDTFPRDLVNALFQEWDPIRLTIYHGYIFSLLWSGLCYGEILWTTIELGAEPHYDRSRAQNNQLLTGLQKTFRAALHAQTSNTVLNSFSAKFTGGSDIGDGYFEWRHSLYVGVRSKLAGSITEEIPPMRAPLEVGYTKLTTTLYHLNTARCLARWPYGSTAIYVFWCSDRWKGPLVS